MQGRDPGNETSIPVNGCPGSCFGDSMYHTSPYIPLVITHTHRPPTPVPTRHQCTSLSTTAGSDWKTHGSPRPCLPDIQQHCRHIRNSQSWSAASPVHPVSPLPLRCFHKPTEHLPSEHCLPVQTEHALLSTAASAYLPRTGRSTTDCWVCVPSDVQPSRSPGCHCLLCSHATHWLHRQTAWYTGRILQQ